MAAVCGHAADPTAWLTRSRRLARDYERLPAPSEALILFDDHGHAPTTRPSPQANRPDTSSRPIPAQ
jgi:hypothetical protein